MPIFRPLASLVWPENEVTDGQADRHVTSRRFPTNAMRISKLPPSLHSGGIKGH